LKEFFQRSSKSQMGDRSFCIQDNMVNKKLRILVIRTDRIGDVILSLPVITALSRSLANVNLTMLIHPGVRDIVEDYPGLDDVIIDKWDGEGIRGFIKLVHTLRLGRFDVALCLHPTLRLATGLYMAGINQRIGTGYRFYSLLFNRRIREHRKNSLRHEAEYNLSLAAALGVDVSDISLHITVLSSIKKAVLKRLEKMGIGSKRPLVVLHPGSKGSALEWPGDRFAQLADRLVCELGAQVIITGGEGEVGLVNGVAQKASEHVWTMAGVLNLKELAALFKVADLLVANSTGPLHIGSAVGTEVIGLFPPLTPASARRWGPFNRESSTVTPDLPECRSCRYKKCSKWNCMELISVEEVLKLAKEKLS